MSEKIIEGLDIQECKILKQIIIIDDKQYGESVIGNIFYKRNFSDNYNLIKQKEENEKSNNDSSVVCVLTPNPITLIMV